MEKTPCMISTEVCFAAQRMVHLCIHLCHWKRTCILLVLHGVVYKCWLDPLSSSERLWLLSHCTINCQRGIWSLQLLQICLFLFSSISFCFTGLRLCCSAHTHLAGRFFLVDWPVYYYITTISVSGNFLSSQVYFIWH